MRFVCSRSLQTGLKTALFETCFNSGFRLRVSSSWLEILIVKYRLSNGSFLTFTPKKERPTACFFLKVQSCTIHSRSFCRGLNVCDRSFLRNWFSPVFVSLFFNFFLEILLIFYSSDRPIPKPTVFFEFICHYLVTRVLFTHELAIVFTPTGSPLLRPLCFCRSTPSTQFAWTIRLNNSLEQFAYTVRSYKFRRCSFPAQFTGTSRSNWPPLTFFDGFFYFPTFWFRLTWIIVCVCVKFDCLCSQKDDFCVFVRFWFFFRSLSLLDFGLSLISPIFSNHRFFVFLCVW